MGIKSVLGSIFSTGAKELADTAFRGIDELITSKEEKGQIEISLEELKIIANKNKMDYSLKERELQYKITDQEFKDRDSARKANQKDPWTPRILTLLFTFGFIGLVFFMLSFLLEMTNVEMNDFVVAFISTIFGSVSTIMTQIISYYFGASKGADEQNERIAESFNIAGTSK